MDSVFQCLCLARYAVVKAQHPGEGRRKWKLRIMQEFWDMPNEQRAALSQLSFDQAQWDAINADHDPYDEFTSAPGLGILVRADHSSDDAWHAFHTKLREAELEFALPTEAEDNDDNKMDEDAPSTPSSNTTQPRAADEEMESDSDSESSSDAPQTPIFIRLPYPPSTSPSVPNAELPSNLTLLRLLNDPTLLPVPPLPLDQPRLKPHQRHRLVDLHGFTEVYEGKQVWMYDGKSNEDMCVRVVSQRPGGYGNATGDSWRARATHLPELQVNLSSGAMTIDFGGLDRYDSTERKRNLEEANTPIA